MRKSVNFLRGSLSKAVTDRPPPISRILPDDWKTALNNLGRGGAGKVAVIGGTDAGKSTFVTLLMQRWLVGGFSAQILDVDPGQKMIGPPACITLARQHAGESEMKLAGLSFVGSTSCHDAQKILRGTLQLVEQLKGKNIVINMSGYISGGGVELTLASLSIVRPDVLVAIGAGCDEIIRNCGVFCILLQRPQAATRKTEGFRRAVRNLALRDYFREAFEQNIETKWQIDDYLRPYGELDRNMLCALEGVSGRDMALGIALNCSGYSLKIIAPPIPSRVVNVRLGEVWLRWTNAGWDLQPRG